MVKRLISFDDEAEGLGLPGVVEEKLDDRYSASLDDRGEWNPDTEYPAGSIVTHAGGRWYGSAEREAIPERTNLILNPRLVTDNLGLSTYSGVTAGPAEVGATLSLSSDRPQAAGLARTNTASPVIAGENVVAGLVVENTGAAPVRLQLAIVTPDLFDKTTNLYGDTTEIPAGETSRLTVGGVIPAGKTTAYLELQTGIAAPATAGTALVISQPILEHADVLRDYFDGATPPAVWAGEPDNSASLMPASSTLTPPVGEPGVSESWVQLSTNVTDPLDIIDGGVWSPSTEYLAGTIVSHDSARWIGAGVDKVVPERTNWVPSPRFENLVMWSTFSGVTLTEDAGAGSVTLTATRPGNNGLIQAPRPNAAVTVAAGDTLAGAMVVENTNTFDTLVYVALNVSDGTTTTAIQGSPVSIPAGGSRRLTVAGTAPAGAVNVILSLVAGTGGLAAGTTLVVSDPILEKAPKVGAYFDGYSPEASWSGEPGQSTSLSPSRRITGGPDGEPGVDASWVKLSAEIEGLDEVADQIAQIEGSVTRAEGAAGTAETLAAQAQASATGATTARTYAETASTQAASSNAGASTARTEAEAIRDHVDTVAAQIDGSFAESVPPRLSEGALSSQFASKVVEEQVAPQKMLFELPVPKPHRAPNMSLTRVLPDSSVDIQVIFTEGTTLWGTARDRSLYKSTSAGQWEHKAYLSSGVAPRGGMVRCADGSLLHFDTSYRIRRSTNDGSSWTIVHERRAVGLEPLTTQSIVVQPGTGHIYYGEYTNGTGPETVDCALWRSTDHGATWHIIHTWPLLGRSEDPGVIRHIHSVQVDPYTSEVYVMLGDGTPKTGIWKVQGDTCVPVLTNEMLTPDWLDSPRCIGMMFFPDWIAWGSDSTTNPYLFRIPRAALGVDPSQLERGPRLSSTAWGTARASEDGSRWVMFASDEQYPTYAADRMAHIYAVEDQGATLYEVGAVPSRSTTGVTTLQPMAQPEKYGLDFGFNMRSGSSIYYGAWLARLGYGGQTIPWPTQPKQLLTQSQSSGPIELAGAQNLIFGGTRVPVYAKTLAIYDSTVMQQTGSAGNLSLQIVVNDEVVWSSAQASSRAQGRREFGGPVTLIPLTANTSVVFQVTNLHGSNPVSGAASITFGWVE